MSILPDERKKNALMTLENSNYQMFLLEENVRVVQDVFSVLILEYVGDVECVDCLFRRLMLD